MNIVWTLVANSMLRMLHVDSFAAEGMRGGIG
jgi:hypothetical protein